MFRDLFRKLLAPFSWFFEAHAAGHYRLERHSMGLTVGIIAAASVGGLVEIAPLFTIDETVEEAPDMRVYTPSSRPDATSTSARAAMPATAR